MSLDSMSEHCKCIVMYALISTSTQQLTSSWIELDSADTNTYTFHSKDWSGYVDNM